MSLKNEEVDRLARELARRRGSSITDAVADALRAELARERRKLRPRPAERLMDIGRRYTELPTLDDRSDDDILGYGELGLPS